jgi:anti-sigma-K factor RskA
MTPEEREALLASYALGTLSAPDIEDVERLLHSDPEAAAEVEQYREISELIALSVPLRRPPSALRERVITAARRGAAPSRRRWHVPIGRMLPAAGLAAVLVLVMVWAVDMQRELQELRQATRLLTAVVESSAKRLDQLTVAEATQGDRSVRLETQLHDQQLATAVLTDPEAVQLELSPTSAAHGATGSFAWSASADAVVVNLLGLSPLPFGSEYRVLLSDRFGNYIASAGTQVDEVGNSHVTFSTPPGGRPALIEVIATDLGADERRPEGPIVLEGSTN